jgi:hypothetical protein
MLTTRTLTRTRKRSASVSHLRLFGSTESAPQLPPGATHDCDSSYSKTTVHLPSGNSANFDVWPIATLVLIPSLARLSPVFEPGSTCGEQDANGTQYNLQHAGTAIRLYKGT